jgi:hypothetical protein
MTEITEQLKKLPPEQFKLIDWVNAARVGLQGEIVSFLLRAYGSLLAATVAIILLQGFHLFGFDLDARFLNWLGGATVGQIVGLLALTIRLLFKFK